MNKFIKFIKKRERGRIMKKTKRLLSFVISLAMTASAFTALAVPASAEKTQKYALDLTSVTKTGDVTTKAADGKPEDARKPDVVDFGSGTETTAAVPALDGWGYQHFCYVVSGSPAETQGNRQTSAGVNKEDGYLYLTAVGNSPSDAALSFIPANVDDLTPSASGVHIYEFDASVLTTGGTATGDMGFGFTSGTGDKLAKVGSVQMTTTKTANEVVSAKLVMVHDLDNKKYIIYKDGIQGAAGTVTDEAPITGIYTGVVNYGYYQSRIANLKYYEDDVLPAAGKVSFVGYESADLQHYDSVLEGTKLEAPNPPSVPGMHFEKWVEGTDTSGTAVTEFVAGNTDKTYTAVYSEGSVVSTVEVKSNPYAKITLQSGDDDPLPSVWTDADGNATIADIPNNTDYKYTIEKKGYTTKTGTFTLGIQNYELTDKAVLDADHEDYLYYEGNWTDGKGSLSNPDNGDAKHRSMTATLGDGITFPEDMSAVTVRLRVKSQFASRANDVTHMAIKDEDGTVLFGLRSSKTAGIEAFTGWQGSNAAMTDGYNETDVVNKVEVVPPTGAITSDVTVDFTVNKATNQVTVTYNNMTMGVLPLTVDEVKKMTTLYCGCYRESVFMTVYEVSAIKPDPMSMVLAGDDDFAKVGGKTIEKQYTKSEVVSNDAGFTWTIIGAKQYTAPEPCVRILATYTSAGVLKKIDSITEFAKDDVIDMTTKTNQRIFIWDKVDGLKPVKPTETEPPAEGMSIDNNGKLSVTDAAKPGKYVITATGDTTGKTASIEITIDDFQELDLTTDGPRAFDKTDATGEYKVLSAVDSNGDDINDLVTPVWSIDDSTVAEIDSATGALSVKAEGEAKITVTVTNGTAVSTAEIPVIVGKFDKEITPADANTVIDVSDLVAADDYLVTASKDGAVVSQKKLSELTDNKFDATGADKVEVGVIYNTKVKGNGTVGYSVGDTIAIPAGTYKFEITGASGDRGDIYANEQILVNNILQNGATVNSYTANDIVVKEGYATMKTYDDKGVTANVTISKVPASVTRVPKMFTLGDSLVCIYYNGGSPTNNLYQTGWGQVLQDYITDSIEVVDLANSGVTAPGLYSSAFTQIRESAKEGDYLVLESGYNDKTYVTVDDMKTAVRGMVDEALEIGMKIILVSPNASQHDYGSSVAWSGNMKAVADEYMSEQISEGEQMVANPKYTEDVDYIDLAAISYKFLNDKYGADYGKDGDSEASGEQLNELSKIYNVDDRLHSTYNAANCWAAVVAQNIKTIWGADVVAGKEDHTYTFTDGKSDEITVGIGKMPELDGE